MPTLPTARHGLGAVASGNRIYVLAGGPTPGGSQSALNEVVLRGRGNPSDPFSQDTREKFQLADEVHQLLIEFLHFVHHHSMPALFQADNTRAGDTPVHRLRQVEGADFILRAMKDASRHFDLAHVLPAIGVPEFHKTHGGGVGRCLHSQAVEPVP